MKNKIAGMISLTVLLLTQCGKPFLSQKPLSPVDSLYLIHQVQKHADQLKTLQGWGTLQIRTEETALAGSFQLSMKGADSLWLKIEGPLGIDIAKICATQDSIIIYSPMENMRYTGSIQSLKNSPILPFPVQIDDFLNGLSGLLAPQSAHASPGMPTRIQGHTHTLRGKQDWIQINPKGPVVQRWVKTDRQGKALYEWQGENFKKDRGVVVPYTVRLTTYHPEQRVIIKYNRMHINRELKSGWADLKIPQSAVSIRL